MKVSVLIHNYNRGSALKKCLESLRVQNQRPLEIVLLDAGSTDDSIEVIGAAKSALAEAGIELKTVSCARAGVAASRNLAASHASGELLCSIDNDATFAAPDALAQAAEMFAMRAQLGAVSFRVLYGDSTDLDPFAWIFRRNAKQWSARAFPTFIFAGTGFCIRAKAFHQAGGFWEHLRYSREEEDLGMELVNQGWEIEYTPMIEIRHYADTRGRDSLMERRRMELRNGLLVLWRRLPIPIAVGLSAARIGTMTAKSLLAEHRFPMHLLRAIGEAAVEWRDAGLRRKPITISAAWRYARLHYS